MINEVTLHYKRPRIESMPKLNNSIEVIEQFYESSNTSQMDLKEQSWVILMNTDNRALGISKVFSGTINYSEINFREIFQLALVTNAVKIILIHNHPSGNMEPSNEDVKSTKSILQLAELMDIYLIDHLIVSSEGMTSIKNRINF